MKRNSERSRPTPSPPRPRTWVASFSPPMLATTSMRVPSSVTAGSMRVSEVRPCGAARTTPAHVGCAATSFGRGVKPQRALVAVENDKRAVRYFECGRLDSGQRGNAERASKDCHVGCRATARRAKAHHARAVERRRVRGSEIFGNEDGDWPDTPAAWFPLR